MNPRHSQWLDRYRRAALPLSLSAVLITVVSTAIAPLWDADLWWLITAGRSVLDTGTVPRTNAWSFTAPNTPWVMHEWLFGVLYSVIAEFSLPALALVRVCAVAAVGWSIARARAQPIVTAVALWTALMVFGGRFESVRPLGPVCAIAAVYATLAFDRSFGAGQLVAMTVLAVLWSNLHGSFVLAPAMAVCAWLDSPGSLRRLKALAVVTAVTATFITPYGTDLHTLVLRYLSGASRDATAIVHARVLEWWPLWRAPLRVATVAELLGLAVLSLTWLCALREKQWRGRAALGLALVVMALRHNRHVGLAGVLGSTLAVEPLSQWFFSENQGENNNRRAVVLLVVAMLSGVGTWAVAAKTRGMSAWVDPGRDDDDMKALVEGLSRDAKVWTTLPYTGWVLLNRPPGVRVFWDSRNDCYPAEVLRVAFDVNDGVMPPDETVERFARYGVTHALAPCHSRASHSLARWTVRARQGQMCQWEP